MPLFPTIRIRHGEGAGLTSLRGDGEESGQPPAGKDDGTVRAPGRSGKASRCSTDGQDIAAGHRHLLQRTSLTESDPPPIRRNEGHLGSFRPLEELRSGLVQAVEVEARRANQTLSRDELLGRT